MKKGIWKLSLLVLPASLFAGQVVLNDGTDTATFNGSQITVGSNNCSTTCTVSGIANISSFLLHYIFTTTPPLIASGTAPDYTLSGGAGTFSVDDIPDAGGDIVSGTISLTTATESGASNQNVTLGGSLTATGLTAPGGPDTTIFLGLLSQIGIAFPVPPTQTENLVINISNCNVAATTVSCLPPTTISPASFHGSDSIQAALPTGTVSSVGITSSVPEPGTMLLMGLGLAGLVAGRRVVRKA